MILESLAAILLATLVSLSVSQEAPPPAVPRSLDNYGGDDSDYSIMYTRNLQDVMDRFQISKVEMEEMLKSYVAGGLPTITKTVFNPDTNLNETITLDFKSFAEGDSFPDGAPITSPRTSARTAADRVAQSDPGATHDHGVPEGISNSIDAVLSETLNTDSVALTDASGAPLSLASSSDDSVSASLQDFLKDPSPIGQNIRPPPSIDVTAMREHEAKLIEELKLLKRRREALKNSYERGEINQENYRTNVENNDLQSRDTYMVLQQIQNEIRRYLGIPTQPAQGFRQVASEVTDDTGTTTNIQPPLSSAESQQLSPDEELTFIQSEINQLKRANNGLLQALQSLRMPNVRTDAASANEILTDTGASSDVLFGSPSFMDTVNPDMSANGGAGTSERFSVLNDLNLRASDSMPSPSPVPAVSGFASRSDISLLESDPRSVEQTSHLNLDDERSQFPSVGSDFLNPGTIDSRIRSSARNDVNRGRSVDEEVQNLMDEYNALSRREDQILRILNRNRQDRATTTRRRHELISEPQMRRDATRMVSPAASFDDVGENIPASPSPSFSVSEITQSVVGRPDVRSRLPSETFNDLPFVDNTGPSIESRDQLMRERQLVGSSRTPLVINYDDLSRIRSRQLRPSLESRDQLLRESSLVGSARTHLPINYDDDLTAIGTRQARPDDLTRIGIRQARPSVGSRDQLLRERSLVGSARTPLSINYDDDLTAIGTRQARPDDLTRIGIRQARPSVGSRDQLLRERSLVGSAETPLVINYEDDLTAIGTRQARPDDLTLDIRQSGRSVESRGQLLRERSLVEPGGSSLVINDDDALTPRGTRQVRPSVESSDFANLGSQQTTRVAGGDDLVYNDGTITVAAVQPASDAAGGVPTSRRTSISGFSAEADGRLPSRRNTLLRQNRRVRFRSPFGFNFVPRNRVLLRNRRRRVLLPRNVRTQVRRRVSLI